MNPKMFLQSPLVLALLPAVITRVREQFSPMLLLYVPLNGSLIAEILPAYHANMLLTIDVTF